VNMDATVPVTSVRNEKEITGEHDTIYHAILEASTDAIFMESLEGQVLDCNSSACRMFGYSREEFLELTVADLVPPEIANKIPEVITQELASGGAFIKAENRKKDGKVFPVEVNTQLFTVGNETKVIVFVRDMSERQRAEKVQSALHRISESAHTTEYLGELYSSIHSIICELMPAKNFYIALYEPVTDMISFPYYADEVDTKCESEPRKPGMGMTEYILKQGQPLLATPEVYEKLVADGKIELVGAPSIDWLGVPLISQQKIIGVMAVQTYDPAVRLSQADQDVLAFVSTQVAMAIERKQVEKARRESEARYRTLFETAPVSIVLSTPQGQILEVNQVALDMLGSPSAEATKAINMLTFSPLIQAGFSTNFQKCVDTKQLA
jgi:PAS domain S-box-containing protein